VTIISSRLASVKENRGQSHVYKQLNSLHFRNTEYQFLEFWITAVDMRCTWVAHRLIRARRYTHKSLLKNAEVRPPEKTQIQGPVLKTSL
jgi:hypothetical protein